MSRRSGGRKEKGERILSASRKRNVPGGKEGAKSLPVAPSLTSLCLARLLLLHLVVIEYNLFFYIFEIWLLFVSVPAALAE